MKDLLTNRFQEDVENVLIRHKSLLDILTKIQESSAKINRSVIKSATSCGCTNITASKQNIPLDIDYDQLKSYMDNHLKGNVCEGCKEKIKEEIGKNLFYISALCNSLGIALDEVILEECKKIETLGKFSLY